MKPLKVRKIASGVALLSVAVGSFALTLGRTQGAAWVGRPLDVQIQVQSDSVEDLQSDCLAANVLYGETQVDPARVSVSSSSGAAAGAWQSVRVVSTAIVDEPIVTVQLRMGCQQKLSKRYVLFAELPTNVVESIARSAPPGSANATRQSPVDRVVEPAQRSTAAQFAVAASEAGTVPLKTHKTHKTTKAAIEPAMADAPGVAPRTSKPATKVPGKSRLKLDPLELMIERDPILRASTELLTLPKEDDSKRSEAAALWRSLNLSSEQLLHDEARARTLESDIKTLHALTTQNQKGLIELESKVQQAESERYSNWLVYSLLGLWMASLVALVWFWRRPPTESASDWLDGHDAQDSRLAELVQSPLVDQSSPVASAVVAGGDAALIAPVVVPGPAPVPLTEVDLDLGLMEPVGNDPFRAPTPHSRGTSVGAVISRDFSPSLSPGIRTFDSEELMDAREQAGFFVSLGQHDKAIDILTTRIAQCGESSPLVCLDLLKIYHALGREDEFEFMRTEFNHWFAGYVPEFSAFGGEGRALDEYPQIMEQIAAHWPTPAVLEYIEACMYHHAGESDGVVFDLQAYLDLLFLHGVAKHMVRQSENSDGGFTSEALRVPARVNAEFMGDASHLNGGIELAHRAGAYVRGAQFGVMKYPPTTPSLQSEVVQQAQTVSDLDRSHTDLNFLGLR